MKLQDAITNLEPIINRKLGDFLSYSQLEDITINKGKTGQLLEIVLGLTNSSRNLDFDDGELKTNKCDRYGKPLETMFITQIKSIIDDLLEGRNFYDTNMYHKIKNLLYVPICKEGNPEDWFFLPYVHINLEDDEYSNLRKDIEIDYYEICCKLKNHIELSADGFIHTSNGKYIQIRSKDSKPYHPIYSRIYNRHVSNKNHAFYFKKEFMKYITTKEVR